MTSPTSSRIGENRTDGAANNFQRAQDAYHAAFGAFPQGKDDIARAKLLSIIIGASEQDLSTIQKLLETCKSDAGLESSRQLSFVLSTQYRGQDRWIDKPEQDRISI